VWGHDLGITGGDDRGERGLDRGGGLGLAQVVQHEGGGPDLPDRVRDALARDVRGGPVHRLEEGRECALRVDVGAGRDADRAGAGRSQVGEDVAEQVRGYDDVEPVRVQDEVRGEDVDVELVDIDGRVGLR